MASADELVELKRRLMAGEIDADEYRRAKAAAYRAGAPRSRSDRLLAPSDSGRIERADSGRLAATRPTRQTSEAKQRLLAEEAQRRRGSDPGAAALAAQREGAAAKESQRLQAVAASEGVTPAEAAIAAKRAKMAAAMARRRAPEELQGPRLVVIVRPRGMRTTHRLAREAAERMRQEGLRLADEAAKAASLEASPPTTPPQQESSEDYIERRLREARERLRGQ